MTIHAWVDGASSGGWGPGGYGVVIGFEGDPDGGYEFSGEDPNTTNQRMEIMGAIAALEDVEDLDGDVRVYSDSAYVVNCMRRGWWKSWQLNGWRTSSGNAVANRDLWERLIAAVGRIETYDSGRSIEFRKVRGHSNDENNNRADYLAVKAKERIRSRRAG